ncbi:MAG: nucleoside kinase [Oscillospiraceae bacterium]|nr:nucleoside kinase [Oscillospiraceae bacterium]
MFELSVMNEAIRRDPVGYIAECDANYFQKVADAADLIAASGKRVILLAGPSSSGKTTTARNISAALAQHGLHCYAISMDDYYLDVNAATYPQTDTGEIDLESPLCLDIPLFNEQMRALHRGDAVLLPRFDFHTRSRDYTNAQHLQLKKDEVVICEGIHGLNDMFTSQLPHAYTLSVNLHSHVMQNGTEIFLRSWTRLMRRLVRDSNYRNTPLEQTLALWTNVRLGEQRYIAPYISKAHTLVDTALGYEIPVLGHILRDRLAALPRDVANHQLVELILHALPLFAPLDPALVPESSLLKKEFIK